MNHPAPTDAQTAAIAHTDELATKVRTEFAAAVEHLTNAVRHSIEHRQAHDQIMKQLGEEHGVVVMAFTRMHDLSRGQFDVRPVDPVNLALEAAVRATLANGRTPPVALDVANGPSTQIR